MQLPVNLHIKPNMLFHCFMRLPARIIAQMKCILLICVNDSLSLFLHYHIAGHMIIEIVLLQN